MSFDKEIEQVEEFKTLALDFITSCKLTSLSARSKGKEIIVGRNPTILYDDIVVSGLGTISGTDITVKYEKPADAFQHPNEITMKKALNWLLDKIEKISVTTIPGEGLCKGRKTLNLLEMYCGCGAHTVAIGKCASSIFSNIVAVEIDPRLVTACENNIKLNGLESFINVTKADAAMVAKRILGRRKHGDNLTSTTILDIDFDVLLVDPPRQGLDKKVCDLAMSGEFQHVLYVSCGRHALKRDLVILCDFFYVNEICVTDLFPRTDSVESLVWLTKRG